MRKLVLKMSVSIDGFVGGPNGEIDWLLRTINKPDKQGIRWIEETLWQAGVHIMGSKTFHDMSAYWPTSADILAAPMNEIPKVVFSKKGFIQSRGGSTSTTQAIKDSEKFDAASGIEKIQASAYASTWANAAIENDLVNGIAKLKQQPGKFILAHGGAGFAQELVKHNLIDEYRLVIHPVVLGKGLALFASAPEPFDLKLESSTPFASGIIANVYTR